MTTDHNNNDDCDVHIYHILMITVMIMMIRGGNRLYSQPLSECDYLQSTRVYGDYQLIIAINSTTL